MINQALAGISGTFSNAGLAEGTNSTTIKTSNILHFAYRGVGYTKAATDNIAPTACAVQADDTTCLYLVSIVPSTGALVVTKGEEVLSSKVGRDGVLYLPDTPAGQVAIGYIKVSTDGATFTMGTTDLGASNIYDEYVNFLPGPVAPLQTVITA